MSSSTTWPVGIEIPVAWGDMDSFVHVNNAVYLRWFESARIAYFLAVGMLDRMESDGVGPILARATIDFRKPVTFPDRVTVCARVPELRNTSFTMTYRVTSQRHAVVAEGDSVVVMLSYRTGEKVPLSEELRKRVAAFEARADAPQ